VRLDEQLALQPLMQCNDREVAVCGYGSLLRPIESMPLVSAMQSGLFSSSLSISFSCRNVLAASFKKKNKKGPLHVKQKKIKIL
jgi:hypothetical protein